MPLPNESSAGAAPFALLVAETMTTPGRPPGSSTAPRRSERSSESEPDDVVEQHVRLCVGRIVRVEVPRDRRVHEVDPVRASSDQAREDPVRQRAEAGCEDLVARDLDPRRDPVRSKAVECARDPARDPGAVALVVLARAVAQPELL